ncbi:hypothetical protein AJ79_01964 [Helicocarpus griseus UAMH5409]|uniref:Uncharacterized protein n=1 Tax=Helicocarpus griseus UAMH5409 TaxID=1447875 RepID=A0A2B7Y6E1_9EURO|nr:hypothetical protein AJ79_01964 [Helicocarpus griseus UAMH5409]
MVLVTSSTISVAISSSIIGLFTLLLFLSGYVLQQQSVRGIQAAISPDSAARLASRQYPVSAGSPAAAYVIVNQGKDAFASPDAVLTDDGDTGRKEDGHSGVESDQDNRYGQKNNQAYLQITSKPSASDICSSLLLFKTLASKSDISTDRIFLYPQSWDKHSPTKAIAKALENLRAHQDEYGIIIHAIDMTDPNHRSPSNTRLLSRASHRLTHYEKLFYLRTPGVLLDTSKIDEIFSSPPPKASDQRSSSYARFSPWKRKRTSNQGSQSEVWVPTRLSTVNPDLPYAFLVTTEVDASSGYVSIRPHVPVPSVKQSLIIPAILRFPREKDAELHPAYVFFEKERDRLREKETVYYQEWKKQVQDVCPGIDVND